MHTLSIRKFSLFKAFIGIVLCLACATLIAGCSQSSTSQDNNTQVSVTAGDTSSNLWLKVQNDTGQDISELYIRSFADTSDSTDENLLSSKWAQNAMCTIYAPIEEDEGESSEEGPSTDEAATGTDIIVRNMYNIRFVTSEGEEYTLHSVSFNEGVEDDVHLCIDEDTQLAYITYKYDGIDSSTLLAEQAAADAAEQEAIDMQKILEEQERLDEEIAAADEAAAVDESALIDDSISYDYSTNTADTSSSVSQSEDSCVDDIVLR